MTESLAAHQARAWEEALANIGVPSDRVTEARRLAERITAAIDAIPDDDVEAIHGFGDYTRGLATIAAHACITEEDQK